MRKSYWSGVLPEAGCCGADAAASGTVRSSVSGDSDNGVPDVSGIVADAACASGFTALADGVWVSAVGLAGSGGTVGK
jgi:hypothetical protein